MRAIPCEQNIDVVICNRLDPITVILAKAGIQTVFATWKTKMHWIPAFAGMTIFGIRV